MCIICLLIMYSSSYLFFSSSVTSPRSRKLSFCSLVLGSVSGTVGSFQGWTSPEAQKVYATVVIRNITNVIQKIVCHASALLSALLASVSYWRRYDEWNEKKNWLIEMDANGLSRFSWKTLSMGQFRCSYYGKMTQDM